MAFDKIKGENRAKKILRGAFETGKIPNAYLFCGNNTEEMSAVALEFAKLLNVHCELLELLFCTVCCNCCTWTVSGFYYFIFRLVDHKPGHVPEIDAPVGVLV